MTKLDLFTRHAYHLPTLAPIWENLPYDRRGSFYVSPQIYDRFCEALGSHGIVPFHGSRPPGDGPILTASYGDMAKTARAKNRKVILMQHGIGHTFGLPAYADGPGRNDDVDLWLAPNQYLAGKITGSRPGARVEVIGTPKVDILTTDEFPKSLLPTDREPVIAISFHWGDRHNKPPESGSAWEHYLPVLEEIGKKYKVIGHAHPSAANARRMAYEEIGIEFVDDWYEVTQSADIYINDLSSTMYEFLLTGKPVIVLNAPWFRREKQFGIRFWDFSTIGVNVETKEGLCPAIKQTLAEYDTINLRQRKFAVEQLFPYHIKSTNRAILVLTGYLDEQDQDKKELEERAKQGIRVLPAKAGVMYMCFGEKARNEMSRSIASLRKQSGDVPVVVVGDIPLEGHGFIEWRGESPFDPDQRKNFQFRAGRIKPSFEKISPFERTLYMDCDTQVEQDIRGGFAYLDHYDFCVAQERHTILELYNTEAGRWHHDMAEREATIAEMGGRGEFPFINSGVFLWKRNERTKELFANWSRQWQRFKQWDEQAALLRALRVTMVKYLVLAEAWNYPHRNDCKIPPVITHLYGRGRARTNV